MIRTFIDKIYPSILEKILKIFDISSGPIVGLWSLSLLVGCMYSIWTTKSVTAPVAAIFSTVITAFASHKIAKVITSKDKDYSKGDDDNGDTATVSKE